MGSALKMPKGQSDINQYQTAPWVVTNDSVVRLQHPMTHGRKARSSAATRAMYRDIRADKSGGKGRAAGCPDTSRQQPGSRGYSTEPLLDATLGLNFLSDCDCMQPTAVTSRNRVYTGDSNQNAHSDCGTHVFSSAVKCGTAGT